MASLFAYTGEVEVKPLVQSFNPWLEDRCKQILNFPYHLQCHAALWREQFQKPSLRRCREGTDEDGRLAGTKGSPCATNKAENDFIPVKYAARSLRTARSRCTAKQVFGFYHCASAFSSRSAAVHQTLSKRDSPARHWCRPCLLELSALWHTRGYLTVAAWRQQIDAKMVREQNGTRW